MNLHLFAVAWTVTDTEGRHLSDEISCRDPCPVRLSTCFAQGILAYHCFPPGCWQGPVSCWTLMNASSLVSHMPEIIKSLPAHTGKNLRRSSGPTSCGKRDPQWDITLSNCILKICSDGDSATSLGGCSSHLWSSLKNINILFLISRRNLSQGKLYPFPLLFMCLLVKRKILCSLCRHPLRTWILWWGPTWAFSSPGWKHINCLVLPHREGSSALWSPSWLSFGPSPACPQVFWMVKPSAAQENLKDPLNLGSLHEHLPVTSLSSADNQN